MSKSKTLGICLILGCAIAGFGQACGQMAPAEHLVIDNASLDGDELPDGDYQPTPTPFPTATPFPTPTPPPGSTPRPTPTPPPGSTPRPTATPTPAPTATPPANFKGALTRVNVMGVVAGSAPNPANPNAPFAVFFFVDGAQGQGMSAGMHQPDGFSGGLFDYQLPAQFADGRPRKVYAYAFINGSYVQLAGSPLTYTAYAPTAAGMDYFEKTMKPLLRQHCLSCHTNDYSSRFPILLSPTKALGGTATNNDLINYASGAGGRHRGGNPCGSKNNTPCKEMQQWWNIEFSNR